MIRKIICICCCVVSLSLFSQEEVKINAVSEIPVSIFTTLVDEDQNSNYRGVFTDDLQLNGFRFLIFNDESLLRNSFMVDFRNFGRRGTKFSSQTYKDFDLYKHFPNVPDILSLDQFAINVDREIY